MYKEHNVELKIDTKKPTIIICFQSTVLLILKKFLDLTNSYNLKPKKMDDVLKDDKYTVFINSALLNTREVKHCDKNIGKSTIGPNT